MKIFYRVCKIIGRAIEYLLLILAVLLFSLYIYVAYINYTYVDKSQHNIRGIYNKLWATSGQTSNKVPLIFKKCNDENANVDQTRVMICVELIQKAKSIDEIALVLGHEIAHANLLHTKYKINGALNQDLEAQADKLGAVYMMKIGFNICKGREVFFRWVETKGDNVFTENHPSKIYRYHQLNIGCGKI